VATYQNLGVFYEDQGNFEKAAQIYKQAISATKAKEPISMINLARVYLLGKNNQGAETLIANATPFADKNPYLQSRLLKNKAWLNFSERKYPASKIAIDQAIKLDGTYASPFCLSAQIYEALYLNSDNQWIQCMLIDSEDNRFPEVLQWRALFVKRALSKSH
jgi:tetratricopeptide (TPR) repeat protein